MKGQASEHKSIEAKALSIGYKGVPIVSDIDFSLNTGDFTSIIGINGVGKSTLLRTLAHMQNHISGSVLVDGLEIGSYNSLDLATKMSVVLTEPLASKNLSVLELVMLGRQPYTNWIGTLTEDDKIQVKNAIVNLDLESIQHKKCYELSDGQLQRVMIARALAQDTSIILLDEPTTHLDLFHKVRILKLLKEIAKNTQKTIIYTTHEIDMAIQLCDKMILLDGQNNPFGQPCELIENKSFENIFPKDTVLFDPETGTFKIKK
ncbi:MAG: ABC transporter ATP-binding protein [Pseudozobellia sp.]|nr:ABC transporter ATP-binding protein [Pseudozobellia sp.]|tara:strand:+ start:180 stop:965 length:786 start_codon:yes stop_codon:yes gene_type:complete